MSFHFLAAIQVDFTCTLANVRHPGNLPAAVRRNLFLGAQIDPYSVRSKVTLGQREPDEMGPPL